MNWIYDTWPWYISGPLIALIMFSLLFAGKQLGLSSNLRTTCSILGAGKKFEFFDFDWKDQIWNLTIVLGMVLGGFLASQYLSLDNTIQLNETTIVELHDKYDIDSATTSYLPTEIFSLKKIYNIKSILILIFGGFLVGFGARYAGGCTSGHAISGLSNLQWPSFIAVVGFFIGGLVMVNFIFPLIF